MTEENTTYEQLQLQTIFGPIREFTDASNHTYHSATDQFNEVVREQGWSRIKANSLKIQAVPLSSDLEVPMGILISFLMEVEFEITVTADEKDEKDEADGS